MFRPLLNRLWDIYHGDTLYIPDALYPLIKDWLEKSVLRTSLPAAALLKWKGKKIRPYDEEAILTAYQSCPIHVPERILEKSIVIVADLPDEQPEPEPVREEVKPREEPVQDKPKVKTKIRLRFGG